MSIGMIFYFSGTGNSRWVANQISQVQHEELVFIPQVLHHDNPTFELKEDERVGFVFPVYSWGPPPIVLAFIKKLTLLNYQSQYVFFVCTCGDDTGLTRQVFCRALEQRGIPCHAGFSITMPNNYVLLPGFDVDSKEVEKRKLAAAVPAVEQVNEWIGGGCREFRCYEGSIPWLKTKILNPLFNRFCISSKPFHATDACVGCKRCEKACPVGNVRVVEGKPIWGRNCTSCLACYHICPKQAVAYGKRTKGKGQYFHPER